MFITHHSVCSYLAEHQVIVDQKVVVQTIPVEDGEGDVDPVVPAYVVHHHVLHILLVGSVGISPGSQPLLDRTVAVVVLLTLLTLQIFLRSLVSPLQVAKVILDVGQLQLAGQETLEDVLKPVHLHLSLRALISLGEKFLMFSVFLLETPDLLLQNIKVEIILVCCHRTAGLATVVQSSVYLFTVFQSISGDRRVMAVLVSTEVQQHYLSEGLKL